MSPNTFISLFFLASIAWLLKDNLVVAVKSETDYISLRNYYLSDVSSILSRFNCTISKCMVFAVLMAESGSLYKSKQNSEVTGDGGYSIGFMQVSKYALADVNNRYSLNYSFNDLYKYYENLVVGILYLQICYESSLKEATLNPQKLSFKKYNGGVDETESSNNPSAEAYSLKVYDFYKVYYQLNQRL